MADSAVNHSSETGRRLTPIFAAVAVLVVASTYLAYWMGLRVTSANQAVIQNQEVIGRLKDLFSSLRDAESAQRGFVLTGDGRYLEPYEAARQNIDSGLDQLQRWASAEVISPDGTQATSRLARERLAQWDQTIQVRRQHGLEAVRAIVDSEAGNRGMDDLRRQVGRLEEQERAELIASRGQRDAAIWHRTLVTVASSVIVLAFLHWAFRRIQRVVGEAVQAEAALRDSQEQLRRLGDNLPDSAVYQYVREMDGSVRFLYFSAGVERLNGVSAGDVLRDAGTLHRQILPEYFAELVEREARSARDLSDLDMELPMRGPDGQVRWMRLHSRPRRLSDGRVVWDGVQTDVTDQRRAEAALEAAKNAAEHANRAKDHFLAVLSHELRTPLTPVLAGVSLLQADPDRLGADTREHLEMIRRNVELEARLIDDLLDVTRISRGKIELDKEHVELGTILQRAVEVCKPDIEARRLHFGVDIEPGPHVVHADVARLQQVFWNLLKNAVKFTPLGGCVGVRCWREDDQVLIEVSDSGVGLEPEALTRIFDAFEQVERSITRQFGGLGLGLTISKAMVELHGGTISARSAGKGQGAVFQVRLPLVQRAAAAELKPPPQASATERQPLRILLVEDHGDTARIMRLLLSAEGHEVETAADVATAMDLAGRIHFDLLLSDLGLPDGSGIDLMRQLRERGLTLPGVALSGYGQEQDLARSREAGFAAHLIKPVSLDQLNATIAAVAYGARTAQPA